MSDSLKVDLASAMRKVSGDWKKAKRRADKEDRVSGRDLKRLRTYRPPKITIREAAFNVMEQAYMKASSNGAYYANARQIMYAARPLVLELTGGEIWRNSNYFTQKLLKDFLEDYAPGWKVVWDSRGHITEPHTKKVVGLGGIEVMKYTKDWTNGTLEVFPSETSASEIKTVGPHLRFETVLFIEKEGFDQILEDAGLANKFDMAIMSTKGLPVGAACELAHQFNVSGVEVLVLHDFDLAGFKIVETLRKGTRMAPGAEVTDIGFRLEDVEDLQSEGVSYNQRKDPKEYLRWCGVTEEECEFLVHTSYYGSWAGDRVELNAMTSEEMIEWLEEKLQEHGVSKVIPGEDTLTEAYQRAVFLQAVEEETEKIRERIKNQKIELPEHLRQQVEDLLEDEEASNWDDAIWDIALSREG